MEKTSNETADRKILVQTPSIGRLIAFERVSWPEAEQASIEELSSRLKSFPEGVFILQSGSADVAQITLSPKCIDGGSKVDYFARMRDLPVELNSADLWVTNIAVGENYRGKGYARELLIQVVRKLTSLNKYNTVLAGVTCHGLKQAIEQQTVSSVEEYLNQDMNPALNVFRSAAKACGLKFQAYPPIENYWPENESSLGYGVLVEIVLRKDSGHLNV